MSESLQNALELARLELLDMGLRGNTLLNLRHTASTVPVVGEQSSEIYRLLVLEQRALHFKPVSDDQAATDDEPAEMGLDADLPVLVDPAQAQAATSDNQLQTRLSSHALDRRLVKISNEARGYYEEQGVEILYLALGCLHWSEESATRTLRRAPLVLVPVELRRVGAGDGFKLVYTGADLGPNLTLASKLKSEFHIELPEFDLDGFAFMPYLSEVEQAVSRREGWCVKADDICLGFFSFGKFQMYQDLDPDLFAQDQKPWSHPLIKALLADGFASLQTRSTQNVPHVAPRLTELNFVKDSDSTQTEAALAVVDGSNLVIQGPPGTGKSQSITNIIAELLARGKKVLFVAEKMAALEVVKRRLDECYLGDAVLELHSHKSQRKAVIEELARCLEAGVPQTPDRTQAQARHQQLEHQLDAYCEAVNATILKSGVTYVDALGEHLKLSTSLDVTSLGGLIPFEPMRDWDQAAFVEAGHQVSDLVTHLNEHGSPDRSPWYGSGLTEFSPASQQDLLEQIRVLRDRLEQTRDQAAPLYGALGVPVPVDLPALDRLVAGLEMVCRAPAGITAPGLVCDVQRWVSPDPVDRLLDLAQKMHALKSARQADLIDAAWQADVLPLRSAWVGTADKWWRVMSGEFRQARRTLQGLLKSTLPENAADCLQIIDDILEFQSLEAEFAQRQDLGAQLFGELWQGRDSNWATLDAVTRWLHQAATQVNVGEIDPEVLSFAAQVSSAQRQALDLPLGALRQSMTLLKSALETLFAKARISTLPWIVNPSQTSPEDSKIKAQVALADGAPNGFTRSLDSLAHWLGLASDRVQDLYALSRFNQIEAGFDNDALKKLAGRARHWPEQPAFGLLKLLQASWFDGLVRHAYATRKVIGQFDRAAHERSVAEFVALDKQLFVHAQERLVCQLHERLPSPMAAGEMAIVRREMTKKRRHMPLRQLLREAGRVIQQIKPVFMMSPMSVATYLEHGAVDFDVVVFDEASQVRVADALGALLRARQAVVVGDSRQMPPTDFFSRSLELDDDQAKASQTADIESILGMFVAQGAPQKMLRWHYRSRHDSLIAVSNEEFYDGRLMIFPTPGVHPQATGLRMHHLPQAYYDRGGSRSNLDEARALAQAVMTHARTTPHLTLGVVAFSTAQRDCLLFEIERLRREHPELEGFFNQRRADGENFFVKNLENVQGDERDVIYISIGYGRTEQGSLVPSFGPINNEGGERRLNVLITRAKLAMEVFCNFTADELKVDQTTPFGVRALRSFLAYAQNRRLERRQEQARPVAGTFETYLCDVIRGLGHEPQATLGQSGFYIDIAVRDPESGERFVLGLQTDGSTYQASGDARERDRVRNGVLTGLGWQLRRVWSTDWLRNPQVERERLREAIATAVSTLHDKMSPPSSAPQNTSTGQVDATVQNLQEGAKHLPVDPDRSSGQSERDKIETLPEQGPIPHSDPHADQRVGHPVDHPVDPHAEAAPVVFDGRASAVPEQAVLPVPEEQVSIERIALPEFAQQQVPPYQVYQGSLGLPRHQELHEALPESLQASIRTLVLQEGPMHFDLISRRLADEAGLSRLTARVVQRIEQGVQFGVRNRQLYQQGSFVYAQSLPEVTVRSRAGLPAQYRNIDYISPFELKLAIRQTVAYAFSVKTDDAITASLSLLGFVRSSAKSRAILEGLVKQMVKDGELALRGGQLSLGQASAKD